MPEQKSDVDTPSTDEVPGESEGDRRFRWRLRLLVTSLALTALAFIQSPGMIVSDTKFDLVAKPTLFLEKSLHLWDPIGNFGQVQNQAYGYLFPMGPFFLLGHLASIPAWVIQRAWWSLILVVAFLGFVKLCGVLGIGSGWARILAGLVFALSPRMLTNLGPISIEVWPYALAPWVLIPLVIGSQRGSPRQAAARSGLAAACVGGVNAVASAAILPLSAIWLLTRTRGKRRGSMMRWWPIFVGLATLWWLVPLLILGQYSPPFLDYIESSRGTTATATVADALRGTTKWVPYVANNYVAGSSLISDPLVIIQSGLLVVLGLLGLARRDLVERQFLVLSLLAGLLLVTMGHLGAVAGFLSSDLNAQLDSALAPLRNTHKWDVVIRLPLVVGLAHFLTVVGTKVVAGRREVIQSQVALRSGAIALAVAGLLGGSAVALSTSLASAGTFEATPDYWVEATEWLDDNNGDETRTYVAPGSEFGDYTWGTPMDEAIQALSNSPWATRTVIPLVPGGTIRMMDAIEDRMVSGRGSDGLHDYLSRAGVKFVLVRNDLRERESVPAAARVIAALESTPGVSLAASFGPSVGAGASVEIADRSRVFGVDGLSTQRPAIEIFRVQPNPGEAEASTYRDGDLPLFVGDAERLLTSLDTGVLTDQPVEFVGTADPDQVPTYVILTDGSRRQEVAFGQVHENRSASRAPSEGYEFDRAAHDYAVGATDRWSVVPQVRGALDVSASSSMADADSPGPVEPSMLPFAAIDRDPDTTWVSGLPVDGHHEWRLTFKAPTDVEEITLTTPDAFGSTTRSLEVVTDLGTVLTDVNPGDTKRIAVRSGLTTSLVIRARSDLGQPLRLSEVVIPGVKVDRPLVLPGLDDAWGNPNRIVLAEGSGARSGCLKVGDAYRCVEGAERLSEDGRTLDRLVTVKNTAEFGQRIDVEPWGGAALTAALQVGQSTTVTASSQATHQAWSGAFAAMDGDRATGWVAAANDRDPSLTVAWSSEQRVSGIRIRSTTDLVATAPTRAIIDFSNGQTRAVSLENGTATFKPVRASAARVRVSSDVESSLISRDQSARPLALGVSELELIGADSPDELSTDVLSFPCGSGPDLKIASTVSRTSVQASPRDLFTGQRVSAALCEGDAVTNGSVQLPAGQSRVRLGRGDFVRPVTMVFADLQSIPRASPAVAESRSSNPAQRSVAVPGAAELLLLRTNENAGWQGESGSTALKPVTVDGWQQGWRLSGADDSVVRLHYSPDSLYRVGLAGGLVGLLIVILAALLPRWSRRGSSDPALARSQWGWVAGCVVVTATGGLLGAWPGVAVALSGWLLSSASQSRRLREVAQHWPQVVAAASLAVVYLAYAIRPWGGDAEWMGRAGWPQLLAIFAVSLLLPAAFPRRASRLLSRMPGRSTP